ncbi:hypothetical protein ACFORH_29370 [Amycolatopsis roodepoortensis]|uniref:Uncharacterized protein n=1 Tax=Amycolatopsis roodepoortensis TaxID=700274 RepID=A0ABR9LI41_9PSEU|nr:hypothetical protein [Amycolatopsis roodepoortensis]MBE1580338.1 hypothetical protein [Amycolatopsis roodepoortensis]
MTFTWGGLPGVPHGFVNAAGTTPAELDDGGSLLDGGRLLDGGLLLDGGVVGVVVFGGGQTISNSVVAVPLEPGWSGQPSQRKLALNLPIFAAAFPYPARLPAPGRPPSVTGPVRPADVTAVNMPKQKALNCSSSPGRTFAGWTDSAGVDGVADA